jgi:hypothetical protein
MALASNTDFAALADYLGDPRLAAAFLDGLVDGAVIQGSAIKTTQPKCPSGTSMVEKVIPLAGEDDTQRSALGWRAGSGDARPGA